MDRRMDIVRNIEYQKVNFPEVYERYFEKHGQSEVAFDKINEYNPNTGCCILIKSDDFKVILEEIFHIKEEIEGYDEMILKKGFKMDVIVKDNTITSPIPFKMKGYYIKLVKKIKKNHVDEAALIFVGEKFSFFEKKFIEKSRYKLIEYKNTKELKSELMTFKVYYNEKRYLDKIFRDENLDKKDYFKNSIKESISMKLINKLASQISNSRKGSELKVIYLIEEVRNTLNLVVEKNIIKISKRFMSDDFNRNFLIVENILQEKGKIFLKLDKKIDKLEGELLKIVEEKHYVQIFIKLNKSELKNLDGLINNELSNLTEKLKEVE